MPDTITPLPSKLFFGDGLFSTHYLSERLPTTALWQVADTDALFDTLRVSYNKERSGVTTGNEEDVEDKIVAPVLAALGYGWQKRRVMPNVATKMFPDFLLYKDAADSHTAFATKNYYNDAIGLLEAKRWGVVLEQSNAGKNRSPHLQLRDYLNERPDIRYGIVTNGAEWRLYAREAAASHTLAVNLAEVLQHDTPDARFAFRLFVVLFGRAAFADGGRILQDARAGAERFRAEIEAKLRKQVFDAAEIVGRGFLESPENKLTDADLPRIYENTLIFLYRILFVLNAEARDLLPADPQSQYVLSYGLDTLRKRLTDAQYAKEYDNDGQFILWERLSGLFRLINGDNGDQNERLNIPRYNGGLFDPAKYPFLRTHRAADTYVAAALSRLTFRTEDDHTVTTFDYAGLGERHLGSIYEGLLEHTLRRLPESGVIELANQKGERKAQGAYYTPQDWVSYIVNAALTPLLERIGQYPDVQNATPDAFANAVLNLNVCDPAMGSAHFLVEATSFLAEAVASHPTTQTGDLAYWKRRVVEACIYGVDRNPLAVELAKLSLWLKTVDRVPLNFLDHHLRCGNSLIGTDIAHLPRFPDQTKRTKTVKRGDAIQLPLGFADELQTALTDSIKRIAQIEDRATDSYEIARDKEKLWRELSQTVMPRFTRLADLWTTPYFTENPVSWVQYINMIGDEAATNAARIAHQTVLDAVRPFHWELEFPDVFFDGAGNRKADAGFDAVIGNPPWERIKLAENEFFATRHPEITNATRASDRKALINALPQTDPDLWNAFTSAKDDAERALRFVQKSGFYPRMGRGDTNLYAVFVEKADSLVNSRGRVALLVPSGIATDNTTSAFFRSVVLQKRLSVLLDFENKNKPFEDVDSRFKFSIIVLSGGDDPQTFARCGFFLHDMDEARDPSRTFALTAADFALFNPNTLTCPIFRRPVDVELTRKLYAAAPILIRRTPARDTDGTAEREASLSAPINPVPLDTMAIPHREILIPEAQRAIPHRIITIPLSGMPLNDRGMPINDSGMSFNDIGMAIEDAAKLLFGGGNSWGVRFLRMFDMTNDSSKFKTFAELDGAGYWRGAGSVMTKGTVRYLPLYEAKMIHHYDHRFANGVMDDKRRMSGSASESITVAEKQMADYAVMPRYWVPVEDVPDAAYFIGFRDIARPTDARTMIVTALPRVGVGNTLPILYSENPLRHCLLVNLSSFVLDYVARQKVGGTHINFFTVEQFPVLPPSRYAETILVGAETMTLAEFIGVRVLELVYTAHDMTPFARSLGYAGSPFAWDEARRRHLRAQLDALYFLLYGLNDADTRLVLDTFPIVRRQDEAAHGGRFVTRDLILQYRKAFAAANWDAFVAV